MNKDIISVAPGMNSPEFEIKSYTKLIAEHPENKELYEGRGWCYFVNKEYNKALDDFQKASDLAPQNTYAYGARLNDTIISGGTQNLCVGIASNTTVYDAGVQNVLSGTASNTVITDGMQNIFNQGSAINTTINNGGQQYLKGGTAVNTIINNEGQQFIYYGANANTVTNEGTVILSSGGHLNNYSGNGNLYIYDSNTLSGTTDLGTGQLIFANNSPTTLNINHLSANNAVISMNVNLENQATDQQDQLRITNSYNGSATLSLRNTASVANETTSTGIKLVDIDDNATGTGTFELLGGKWDEGGYIYKLSQSTTIIQILMFRQRP